jgi:hypothetical protein
MKRVSIAARFACQPKLGRRADARFPDGLERIGSENVARVGDGFAPRRKKVASRRQSAVSLFVCGRRGEGMTGRGGLPEVWNCGSARARDGLAPKKAEKLTR